MTNHNQTPVPGQDRVVKMPRRSFEALVDLSLNVIDLSGAVEKIQPYSPQKIVQNLETNPQNVPGVGRIVTVEPVVVAEPVRVGIGEYDTLRLVATPREIKPTDEELAIYIFFGEEAHFFLGAGRALQAHKKFLNGWEPVKPKPTTANELIGAMTSVENQLLEGRIGYREDALRAGELAVQFAA